MSGKQDASNQPHIIHTPHELFCDMRHRRQLGIRNWSDHNVCAVVGVMSPAESNAAQTCPAYLQDSARQQGRCEQNHAAHTCEWTANAATLKFAQ